MTENQRKNLSLLVDTLRRTERPQTNGELFSKNTGAVCALGLASLYFKITPNVYEELDNDEWREVFGDTLKQETILKLNDDEGMNFKEIADHIEYFYLKNDKNDYDSQK